MTTDLRSAIHRHDIEVAALGHVLETDAEHLLRARVKNIRQVLLDAALYTPTLMLEPCLGCEVVDGEHNGRVEPMGTLRIDMHGFAEEFTLEGLQAALRHLLGDVERRIGMGER